MDQFIQLGRKAYKFSYGLSTEIVLTAFDVPDFAERVNRVLIPCKQFRKPDFQTKILES